MGARKNELSRVFEIPIRTIQRWEKKLIDQRTVVKKKPKNKLSDEEYEQIISVCCEKRFADLTPHEIVPILAEEGRYIASESTFYRVLRKQKLLSHRTQCRERQKRPKLEPLKASGPNQVWSWDITYLKTKIKGDFFFLYLFMDIWSRKIVSWDIFEEQTAENASAIFRKQKEIVDTEGIRLHSDNGSPMKGATFLATLHKLGVIPSYSRPSVSNDNAYSESLFKTLKYSETYPGNFETVEMAKEWMQEFVNWYNTEHRHSGIKFTTPEQRHRGEDIEILKRREIVYNEARKKHPERFFNGRIRDWSHQLIVELNPEKEKENKVA